MPNPPFKAGDLKVGDWIKYRHTDGSVHFAEIRTFYPFGNEPTADTSHGRIPFSQILDYRR